MSRSSGSGRLCAAGQWKLRACDRRPTPSQFAGFAFGCEHVPIVPAAILFDLGTGKPNVHPNVAMGEAAAAAATVDAVKEGSLGAGTGATVAKVSVIRVPWVQISPI